MKRFSIATVTIAGLFISTVSAWTQGSAPSPVDPKACGPGAESRLTVPQTKGGTGDGQPAPTVNGSGNLSDKLAASDGVLCPPPVDPGIKVEAPPTGRTPVIPPPGSPGGDQSVQPK